MTELPRLYLITPPRLEDPSAFAEDLKAALDAGGVEAVQLRLKDGADSAPRADILRTADILTPVCRAFDVALILNDKPHLVAEARQRSPVALVFGPERSGLSNADLDLCHALVYIPSNPAYNSLNLAMAVQLIAYELRLALVDEQPSSAPSHPPATVGDMHHFYEHLERVLLASGFLDAGNPRHLMRRLRRLFNRAKLDANELNILRGMLSALVPGSGKRVKTTPGQKSEPS